MKTPLLAALGLALLALAAALYLFTGTKAQEPALGVAQIPPQARTTSALDTPRDDTSSAQDAPVDAQREAADTSTDEAAVGRCVVRVVDERRQPLGGVGLFVLVPAQELQYGYTEADGRLGFGAFGAVRLFAVASARPVQSFDLELTAGEHELALNAPSARVAGVLVVGGAPPAEPVTVALTADAQTFAELELPERLHQEFARAGARATKCAADGSFEVAGLAPDWRGTLRISEGYALARTDARSTSNELALDGPRSDLRIELERRTHLVGRFETASGEVVRTSGAVRLNIFSDQGRSRSGSHALVDERGRFAHVLRHASFDSVEVLLECELGRGARTAQRSELTPTPEGDLDLGVIVLAPHRHLHVRAMSAGSPVVGAKARITGDEKWSEGSAEGRIQVLSAATGPATLRVIAQDFWAQEVPVVLPVAEELVVELAPANVLTITVRDAAGAPLGGATVRFDARGAPLFSESDSMSPDSSIIGVRRGEGWNSSSSRGDVFEGDLEVIADDKGVVELQGLTTQGALTVKLLDTLKQPLVTAPLAPLGSSERRELELRFPAALKSLRGRVVDPDGRLVSSASVIARIGVSEPAYAQTNSAGHFAFDSLSAEELELKVESPHFAPHILPRVALRDATTELEIRLARGRMIVVEIVDESGAPLSAARVLASTPDGEHQWSAGPQAPGRYQFRPLPTGPLTVTAHVYSRDHKREIGDHEESVRFVLPAPGQLTVRLAASVEVAQRKPFVRLRSLDGAASDSKWFSTQAPRGPLDVGALAPGDYELFRAYIGSSELGDAPGLHEVQPPLRVTIRAGETTQVELP